MANLLTDEVRRERYAVCRARRIRCDKTFNLCVSMLAFIVLLDIAASIAFSVAGKMWDVDNRMLLGLPFSLAIYIAELFGIYKRNHFITLVVLLITPIRVFFQLSVFAMAAIPFFIAELTMKKWEGLRKEDGFPKFDIDYAERESRAAKQAAITKHVAIETGKRRLAAQNADEMSDLLDEQGDIPVASAELSGYHDRSRHGKIGEQSRTLLHGGMDDL